MDPTCDFGCLNFCRFLSFGIEIIHTMFSAENVVLSIFIVLFIFYFHYWTDSLLLTLEQGLSLEGSFRF